MIEKLQLTSCKDTKIGGFTLKSISGGERKRTCIGYELITDPNLLLLDEPTSALDAGRAEQLLYLLKRLASSSTSSSTAVVMVNHQLEALQQFCSRLINLHQGQLIQDLPADQIDWIEVKQSLQAQDAADAEEWS